MNGDGVIKQIFTQDKGCNSTFLFLYLVRPDKRVKILENRLQTNDSYHTYHFMKKSHQGKVLLHLNIIAVVLCAALFLFVLLYIGKPINATYFALSALAYAFCIGLTIAGKDRIASTFGIVISNLIVFTFDPGISAGHNTGALYVPLLIFAYICTGYEERLRRWLLISLCIVCIVVVNYTNLSPKLGLELVKDGNIIVLQVFNTIAASVVSLIALRTIVSNNYKMHINLREAKLTAEKTLKEKSRFLSIMSHEIRTPANAVVGLSNLLMAKVLPEEAKQELKLLHYSAQNLKSVIDNIIYYDKLALGKEDILNLPFDIRKFCYGIVDSFDAEADKKHLELHFDFDDRIPQFLIGDPDKLGHIITNLLSNAIKFTRSGDIFLWVKMNHIDEQYCYVRFKMADTGIGIEEDKLQVVFNAFTQLDSEITRSTEGLGLGLTISQKMLKLLGSKMHIESQKGVGTNFYFDVQLELTKNLKDKEEKFIETHDLSNRKILLVEDNKLNVLVAKKILTGMQAEVDVAENGEQGVRLAAMNKYDIILMDIHMPVMDGYQATKHIRERDPNIPIVAFTADVFDEAKKQAKEVGMNDFVSKPFDPVLLYEKIIANLRRS